MAAPGNARRMATDAAVWLPDFWTTPVAERLGLATWFVVDHLVNQSGLALALIWSAAAMVVLLRGSVTAGTGRLWSSPWSGWRPSPCGA
jgi:hypothetical protein